LKRVDANDTASIFVVANYYYLGSDGFQQDRTQAIKLFNRAADLGCRKAHWNLSDPSRCNLGGLEADAGNMKRAVRHFMIAALPGCYFAMQALNKSFEQGFVSRDTVKSTLTAYNNYCAEMRSEAKNHDRNKLYCYE
jgi:TPR repeat protein